MFWLTGEKTPPRSNKVNLFCGDAAGKQSSRAAGDPLMRIAFFSRFAKIATFFAGATIFVAGTVSAQQVPEHLLPEMKWRMIGPFRGGKVNAVAGVPGNAGVYYFGADGGGVWKTTDGGTVWKPIFRKTPSASIGALALAPSNPNIIYAGTGVNDVYSDIGSGNGIYKSTD